MADIYWLDEEHAGTAELGGKGAGLARLHRAGLPVPPGFCVASSAYRQFVHENGLAAPIAGLRALRELHLPHVARDACAALAAPLERARLPDSLVEAVGGAYQALRRRTHDGAVAARSSAHSEDAAAASSAGLYESYLNLRDEAAVLEAVLCCYRSLWSPRAVQYRALRQIDRADEAMAVVVMAMAPSDVAGVAFTINPLTGDGGQITINASWGLGEAIVSGQVTPDHLLLDKSSLAVLAHEVHPKQVETRAAPGGASGTVTVAVPAGRAEAAALSDAQARELAAACLRIERLYGRPVDVEWAFARDRLYVLQARPVTGLP